MNKSNYNSNNNNMIFSNNNKRLSVVPKFVNN